MSSFFRRLFGRSKIDTHRRPRNVPLPAAPDPDDLFDWSPRARPEGDRSKSVGIDEVPPDEERWVSDAPAVAPISDALSQFQRPGMESPSTRPPSVPVRGPSAPPSIPPPPPPPTKPAQIRLLMGDGTVVEVSGDPELARRISYLAENLLAPHPESTEHVAPPPPPVPAGETAPVEPPAFAVLASADIEEGPHGVEESGGDGAVQSVPRRWPQMKLVFTDGSEAALPPDQEIVDRLAYVIANLLPARPTT